MWGPVLLSGPLMLAGPVCNLRGKLLSTCATVEYESAPRLRYVLCVCVRAKSSCGRVKWVGGGGWIYSRSEGCWIDVRMRQMCLWLFFKMMEAHWPGERLLESGTRWRLANFSDCDFSWFSSVWRRMVLIVYNAVISVQNVSCTCCNNW
jgi:hypothetical protein